MIAEGSREERFLSGVEVTAYAALWAYPSPDDFAVEWDWCGVSPETCPLDLEHWRTSLHPAAYEGCVLMAALIVRTVDRAETPVDVVPPMPEPGEFHHAPITQDMLLEDGEDARTPPRGQSERSAMIVRRRLVEYCDKQIGLQRESAEQHPDDARLLDNIVGLHALALYLYELPLSDSRFVRLRQVMDLTDGMLQVSYDLERLFRSFLDEDDPDSWLTTFVEEYAAEWEGVFGPDGPLDMAVWSKKMFEGTQ